MTALSSPFSWHDDPSVPAFDDTGHITVMDAHCALCARGAAWIAKNDTRQNFRIVPVQSPLGAALMRHSGMSPEDPLTWLYLRDGQAYASLDALMKVGETLGGIWVMLKTLNIIPKPLRDRAYYLVARNRYRLMGRADLCNLPDPAVQARLLR